MLYFKTINKILNEFEEDFSLAETFNYDDTGNGFSVNINVAGIPKEKISMEVKNQEIHVNGESKIARKDKKVSKIFKIPQDVDIDRITASYENGILIINLPKQQKFNTRIIKID